MQEENAYHRCSGEEGIVDNLSKQFETFLESILQATDITVPT